MAITNYPAELAGGSTRRSVREARPSVRDIGRHRPVGPLRAKWQPRRVLRPNHLVAARDSPAKPIHVASAKPPTEGFSSVPAVCEVSEAAETLPARLNVCPLDSAIAMRSSNLVVRQRRRRRERRHVDSGRQSAGNDIPKQKCDWNSRAHRPPSTESRVFATGLGFRPSNA